MGALRYRKGLIAPLVNSQKSAIFFLEKKSQGFFLPLSKHEKKLHENTEVNIAASCQSVINTKPEPLLIIPALFASRSPSSVRLGLTYLGFVINAAQS